MKKNIDSKTASVSNEEEVVRVEADLSDVEESNSVYVDTQEEVEKEEVEVEANTKVKREVRFFECDDNGKIVVVDNNFKGNEGSAPDEEIRDAANEVNKPRDYKNSTSLDVVSSELENIDEKTKQVESLVEKKREEAKANNPEHEETKNKKDPVVNLKDSDNYLNKETGTTKDYLNKEFYKLPISKRKAYAKKHNLRNYSLILEQKESMDNNKEQRNKNKVLTISI